ncbi:MAG: hypothetical protein QF886_23750 [Planctomycetota bacterium]|nr:hypothetical protein [Planctomycetota bacterium]
MPGDKIAPYIYYGGGDTTTTPKPPVTSRRPTIHSLSDLSCQEGRNSHD